MKWMTIAEQQCGLMERLSLRNYTWKSFWDSNCAVIQLCQVMSMQVPFPSNVKISSRVSGLLRQPGHPSYWCSEPCLEDTIKVWLVLLLGYCLHQKRVRTSWQSNTNSKDSNQPPFLADLEIKDVKLDLDWLKLIQMPSSSESSECDKGTMCWQETCR